MNERVKSGKEVLDEFFKNIMEIEGVDLTLANALTELYSEDKLTDANVKNKLEELREQNVSKD
jgi:hypothetical protein